MLSANRDVDRYVDQEVRSIPLAWGAHIFKGAFVGLNKNGYARPLIAGDPFAGIAYQELYNRDDDDTAVIRVYTRGDFEFHRAGAMSNFNGCPIYAIDDEQLTSQQTSACSFVGVQICTHPEGKITLRIKTAYDG